MDSLSLTQQSLLASSKKVVGRPPTPPLSDLTIPCIASVQHIIAPCRAFDDPLYRVNQHAIDVIVTNPTQDLALVNRSLQVLGEQQGVPEYDVIIGRDNITKIGELNATEPSPRARRRAKDSSSTTASVTTLKSTTSWSSPTKTYTHIAATRPPTDDIYVCSQSPTVKGSKPSSPPHHAYAFDAPDDSSLLSSSIVDDDQSYQSYETYDPSAAPGDRPYLSLPRSRNNLLSNDGMSYSATSVRSRSGTGFDAEDDQSLTAQIQKSATSRRNLRARRVKADPTSPSKYLTEKAVKPRVLNPFVRVRGPFGLQGPLDSPSFCGMPPRAGASTSSSAALASLSSAVRAPRLNTLSSLDPEVLKEHNKSVKKEQFEEKTRASLERTATKHNMASKGDADHDSQMLILGAMSMTGLAAGKLKNFMAKKANDDSLRGKVGGFYGMNKLKALGVDMPQQEGVWEEGDSVAPTFEQIRVGSDVEHTTRGTGVVVELEPPSKENGRKRRVHVKFTGSNETHRYAGHSWSKFTLIRMGEKEDVGTYRELMPIIAKKYRSPQSQAKGRRSPSPPQKSPKTSPRGRRGKKHGKHDPNTVVFSPKSNRALSEWVSKTSDLLEERRSANGPNGKPIRFEFFDYSPVEQAAARITEKPTGEEVWLKDTLDALRRQREMRDLKDKEHRLTVKRIQRSSVIEHAKLLGDVEGGEHQHRHRHHGKKKTHRHHHHHHKHRNPGERVS